MPEVSVVVELRVDVEPGGNPVELEKAVDAEGKRAARELYVKALQTIDDEATASADAARQRLEHRYVATLFGRVRIHRWRVRKRGEAGFIRWISGFA